jgi:glycosyltransferase involved in cell wall biosynthesis
LYRKAFGQVEQIVAFSTYMQRLLEAEGLPSQHLPMGTPALPFVPLDFESCNVLFVGRLVTFKGVFVLVDAFQEVVRALPRAKLTIAGDGERRRELEEVVERRGLSNSVRFLGHVPARDMAEIYGQSSVVVMPSILPEAFGKVGVEAMSVGRPVVVTDLGGVRDWLDDDVNGILVRPGESGELASALIKLLGDPERARRMSQAGLRTAERFSLERHVERFEQLLERTLKEAG